MTDRKRKRQIEELIWRELGAILLTNSKHVLFHKITITAVTVSPDLAVAKVFFSVFDEVDLEAAKITLQKEAWFLRKLLAHNLNLRLTPRLNFVYDESIKRSRKLTDLIDAAIAKDAGSHIS